jgi:hypothetical protein
MELNIETLKAAGAFVGPLVQQDITWHSGGEVHTATVFVRPSSYATITRDWAAEREGREGTAARIASSICKKDGQPVFTAMDIEGNDAEGRGALCAELTIALLNAMSAANGLGKDASEKKSKLARKSGSTSSLTASAEKASLRPKRT